jgi:prepilin-type N-terminal cleavage/methylation domain-containing protein/prepilin-type processing-associated H-X9-DG protein
MADYSGGMMSQRGLTLLEVIVAAAVLALLVGLVLPTLKSGRESGVSILCGNNLRQMYVITEIYIQDHSCYPHGFQGISGSAVPPPPGGCPGILSYDWPGWWWFNYLDIEDLSKEGILWCPGRRRMDSPFCDDVLWSNYGINYSIAKWASKSITDEFQGQPLRKNQLRRPSETLLYTDSGYALISWKAAAEGLDFRFDNNPLREDSFYLPGLDLNKDRRIHSQQQEDAVLGRHPKQTVNIGYADGQVKKEKAQRLLVKPGEDGKFSPLYLWSAGR